jgi:DNA polymerase-3 subunit delta
LGTAGGVAPWELTDSLDRADATAALRALGRMLSSGTPALVVLGTLNRHYRQMLRLDGANVSSSGAAAELLGVKSDFVAKKALEQSKRLGSERIARAVVLLSDADLDVKGRTGLPDSAVLEVLVARLSRLAPSARPSAGRQVARRR